MKNVLLLAGIAMSIFACKHKTETQESSDILKVNDTVIISGQSPVIKKIKLDVVKIGVSDFTLSTSGVVRAIPSQYAHIASPYGGRIIRSYVRLGQEVDANDPIFSISSPEFFEISKSFYQAKQEMQLAEKSLKRQKDLLLKGVGAAKDVEEAEVNYEVEKEECNNILASLKVFHVNANEIVPGQPLIVRSPIKGRIVEDNIVIGQFLKTDAEPIVTVAELSKVWVVGEVKEKDIRYVKNDEEVEIIPVSMPDKQTKGKIYNVGSMLDEDTRAIQVVIESDNNDYLMKPGMYTTVNFNYSLDDVAVIPSKAVLQRDDASFVFIKVNDSIFVKRKIEIVAEQKDRVVVKSGVRAGEIVVVEGAYYLLKGK